MNSARRAIGNLINYAVQNSGAKGGAVSKSDVGDSVGGPRDVDIGPSRGPCWGGQSSRGRSSEPPPLCRIHPAAHANAAAFSRCAPWAGDKGFGRNGIPKPAGAGGGSSSLSLQPFWGPTRPNNFETTPRLRLESDASGLQSSLRWGARPSSKISAR